MCKSIYTDSMINAGCLIFDYTCIYEQFKFKYNKYEKIQFIRILIKYIIFQNCMVSISVENVLFCF